MEIITIHRATVQYIYADEVSHSDSMYITEELDKELRGICRRFSSVQQNPDFRCQAYGFEIEGDDEQELKEAACQFDTVLLRYVGLIEIVE